MKILKKCIIYIKKPYKIILYLASKNKIKFIKDDQFLKIMYYDRLGKKLNLDNPRTFSEKLQWLKLNNRKEEYTKMVDKYEVREYIADKIGEEYLIPILGVYDRFEDINFEELPKQFVIKCTHDSGGVVICKDKENLDKEQLRRKFNKLLNRNYYYSSREWPYKNVKPRIICEKYMVDDSGDELKDYKFMCFNGEVKCLFVCLNRNSSNGLNVDFYDLEWNIMPFERKYENSGKKIKKPKNFDKMIELSKELSKDIPFLRVDFYEIKGKVYFGELTFYPGSGMEEFRPYKYDEILGSWINLAK